MKRQIKSVIPLRFHSPLGDAIKRTQVIRYYWSDMSHIFSVRKSKSYEVNHLRAVIIKNYHRLEKALASPKFSAGRGMRAAEDLYKALKQAENFDSLHSDIQVIVAINVIQQFLALQDKADQQVRRLNISVEKLNLCDDIKESSRITEAGVKLVTARSGGYRFPEFKDLALYRSSIRYFSKEAITRQVVLDAVSIAQKTPSVCNRQGWHVFLVTRKKSLELFRQVHKGFSSEEQNLTSLLVICFRKSSFSYPLERNQGFIDGGLFSMSLMYALTSLGVASCPLNANIGHRNEELFRAELNIDRDFSS